MSAARPDPPARIECPGCGCLCLRGETVCWRCGADLAAGAAKDAPEEIDFSDRSTSQPVGPSLIAHPQSDAPATEQLRDFSAESAPGEGAHGQANTAPRTITTLTGEVVELPRTSDDGQSEHEPVPDLSYLTRPTLLAPPPEQPQEGGEPEAKQVLRITFCKTCGIQNEETAVACRKCRQPLEVIAEPLPDIKPLRRSWGFDLLGVAWLVLGVAAAYCGRFMIKADPAHPGITWGDYFWTGAVVCAPGVLIFIRHWFCRFMFWAMTFAAAMIWAVIGFIWLYVGLHVDDNGRVGLMWFAALSLLSLLSWATVRLNDEFDAGS